MKTMITPNQTFRSIANTMRTCLSVLFFLFLFLSTNHSWGQIAQRGTATTATATNASVTINRPTGVVQGDIMFANIANFINATQASASCTGWIVIAGTDTDRGRATLLYKIAGASEPANYTFTVTTASTAATGAIIAFSGVNTTTPFDVTSPTTWSTLSNQTINNITGLTTANANAAILLFGSCSRVTSQSSNNYTGWSATNPSAYTELYDVGHNNVSNAPTIGAAWAIRSTAGSTGTGSVTCTPNTSPRTMAGIMVALRPCTTSVGAASSSPTLCQNTALTAITHATVNVTGIGTATGLPAGVTASWASNTITISGTPTASGTFNYSIPVTGGCAAITATGTITVNSATTAAGTLSGTQTVCSNGTVTFTSTVTGGSWSSNNTAVATVNSTTGVVSGVAAGSATMTYTVTGACSTGTSTRTITVTAAPNAGTLSGVQTVCTGSTTTFNSTQSGGAWTSSNTAIATINSSTGVVTGVAAGTATMTYTVTGTGGCANATATRTVTVTAPVTPTFTAIAPQCSGATIAALPTTSTNGITGSWSPALNNTSTTTYTFTPTAGQCATSASLTITVNPVPTSVTASASNNTICVGETVNLNVTANSNSSTAVTVLSQNFNSATNNWTTTNTSTGGTPALAAWTLLASGYNDGNETFTTPDASQFYLSNSDDQGTGGITTTTLVSPAFSTSGMSAATINLSHYYRFNSGTDDRAFVEASTNGTTWTTLTTYSATQGTASAFATANVSLTAPFLNQSNVFIRFRYTASFDWYWAINNVIISGTLTTAPEATYAWTSNPAGFTSSLKNPTGLTPSVTTTYTVTATNSFGCSDTSSVTVNVNNLINPSVSIAASATTICSGTSVTFTATPTNGGSTPSYQWKVNGANVGSNAALFTTTSLQQGDNVTVVMTSNASPCLSGATATSNSISMTVNPLAMASISANNGPAQCYGNNINFTVSGTTNAIVYYNINGGGTQFTVLTGGSATITVSGATTSQTLNLLSVDNGQCAVSLSESATVAVNTTTWDGNAWSNGVPDATTAAFVTGNLTIASPLQACSLVVSNNAVVTVASGTNVTLQNAISVASGSSFTVNNNANLIQVNPSAVNSGNIVVKRATNPLMRLDYILWGSPVTGQNLFNFSPLTSVNPTIRFYGYNSATNIYNAISDYATHTMQLGKGYLIRLPFNHPTAPAVWNGSFTGVPNNGTYTVNLGNSGAGLRYNAVSNPYPSTLDIAEFYNDNASNIQSTLYFWRKTNNSTKPAYCSWNMNTDTYVDNGDAYTESPNGIIQVGQGFFVEAKGSATTVVFKNTQRVGNNANQMFRAQGPATQNTEKHRIWLNITSGNDFAQAVVGYFTNGTLTVDDTDSKLFNDGNLALTSLIGTTQYVVNGRPVPFDASDVIPMSYKATTAGNLTIAIDHMDGLFSATSQDIYLHDLTTNTFHNLNQGPYVFQSQAGTFDNRFELVYQNALSTNNPSLSNADFQVIRTQNTIRVQAQEMIDQVLVFDLQGRLISQLKSVNQQQAIVPGVGQDQAYLVRVITTDGKSGHKKVM